MVKAAGSQETRSRSSSAATSNDASPRVRSRTDAAQIEKALNGNTRFLSFISASGGNRRLAAAEANKEDRLAEELASQLKRARLRVLFLENKVRKAGLDCA
jgi:hypothetical protein